MCCVYFDTKYDIFESHVHYLTLSHLCHRCQDYIEIERGSFGITEECGNTTSSNAVLELEFGNFTVIFRTSEEVRGEGFEMYSLCFKPAERFLPSKIYTLIYSVYIIHISL